MKVTIYGGANNKKYTEKEIACSERLGAFLAKINAEVLTGACTGFPYFVGKAVIRNNPSAKVIGYSPALNQEEHISKYRFPLDGVTHIEYVQKDGIHKAENFLKRSMDMSSFSDIVIAMGGSWGTYSELLFSFFYKKTIILIKEFGGAVTAFKNTWNFFDSRDYYSGVHHGANIITVKNVDEAIKVLGKMC